MTKFLIGFFLGIIVATVGFGGLVRGLDAGVNVIKSTASDAAIITESKDPKD